jgi:3D (Asp-Asp-Asp) domain-containing protein
VIKPGDKFVAAPRNIPFGTLIAILGYNNGKPVPVLDRGEAIKDNKLDLFFPTHKAALEWGRRKIIVKIVE